MAKRVLVAGGAGFIGSHVCERLLARGDEVVCLDDLSSGRTDNVIHLEESPRFTFMRHDVTMPLYLDVDEIYNLACPSGRARYRSDPVGAMKTRLYGAANMLGLGKAVSAKVLQVSSADVYGDPDVHPQPESYRGNVDPVGPRSSCEEGSRAAEALAFDYRRAREARVKVARVFGTYGPRMAPDAGRALSNFIVQALKREPLTVYGDGRQTRSLCYVDDVVDGLLRLMDTDDDVAGPVNVGSPEEMSVLELAEAVKRTIGSPSPIEHLPLPKGDARRRTPDIAVARQYLGWEPRTALAEGLRPTIAYFRTLID